MMSKVKSKSTESVVETLKEQPVIEAAEVQVTKKKTRAKPKEVDVIEVVIEEKEVVELVESIKPPVESEIKTTSKKKKANKTKVIRDSFSFPEQDYLKISEIKKTCLASGVHVKKSEVLRAGLMLLSKLNITELKEVIEQVEKLQTGRPSAL